MTPGCSARRRGDGAGGRDDSGAYGFVLGLVALGTGIPLTAIAGGTGGLTGVVELAGHHAYGQRARRRLR